MVKFDEIVSIATPNCYKFINQRTVKDDVVINVTILKDLKGCNLYVCALSGSVECAYTFQGIKKLVRSLYPRLFDNFNVIFKVVGS